jgi:prephenate dehydratase
MRLAHLGPPGTFGEEAAIAYRSDAELLSMPSHAAVAQAVEEGTADEGVMAIENLLNGSVAETLDILIHETPLRIQHELLLPVVHNLVAPPGVSAEEIEVVFSHPAVFAQCREYLIRNYPEAHQEAALSTAQAVELAVASKMPAAAISTARAAELHGAEILARSIQDTDLNVTRFVIVGKGEQPSTGRDRTSIAFRFADDRPGLVARVMNEFAERNINCSKFESRPTRETFGEYVFLIDFEGHALDPGCRAALDTIRPLCAVLNVFGSYPRWNR